MTAKQLIIEDRPTVTVQLHFQEHLTFVGYKFQFNTGNLWELLVIFIFRPIFKLLLKYII